MKVAIMGFGTIGSGVYKVLTTNEDVIAKRVGEKLEVSRWNGYKALFQLECYCLFIGKNEIPEDVLRTL